MHAMQKTYSSKFNAQRAAERAGIAPDRIEVEKTPDGFIWREKPAATAPAPAPAPRAKGRRPATAKPAAEPKRRHRTSYEELEADAPRRQAAGGAGLQRGDARPVPQQARAPRRTRGDR
jgi:hypothetical protein